MKTIGFNSENDMINSNCYHNESYRYGYLSKVNMNITLLKTVGEREQIINEINKSIEHKESRNDELNETKNNDQEIMIIENENHEQNNFETELNDSMEEESDYYTLTILEEYNISKESYYELISVEKKENVIIISPLVIQPLNRGGNLEFSDYINKSTKENKIYIPLKFNSYWNLILIMKQFRYKKRNFKKFCLNISYKNNTLGFEIENKLKRYVYCSAGITIDTITHLRIGSNEEIFVNDNLFVKSLLNVYGSSFDDENKLQRLFLSEL